VTIIALGIVADFLRSILSPIFNLGIYLVWLAMFFWEEARVVRGAPSEVSSGVILVLFIIPLIAVIGVNLGFYGHAFRHSRTSPV